MKKDLYIDWSYVEDFKRYLLHDFYGKVDCVVGILRGGTTLAVIASHLLKKDVYWFQAQGYNGRRFSGNVIVSNLTAELPQVSSKRVLLVDDIVDKGTTIVQVYAMLKQHFPKKIVPLVMVAKQGCLGTVCISHKVKYMISVPDETWVVFPWEMLKEVGDGKVGRD